MCARSRVCSVPWISLGCVVSAPLTPSHSRPNSPALAFLSPYQFPPSLPIPSLPPYSFPPSLFPLYLPLISLSQSHSLALSYSPSLSLPPSALFHICSFLQSLPSGRWGPSVSATARSGSVSIPKIRAPEHAHARTRFPSFWRSPGSIRAASGTCRARKRGRID